MSVSTSILAGRDVPAAPANPTGMFRAEGRTQPVLVVAFLLINAVVFVNAVLHPPRIGYDTPSHLEVVETLAEGRLATPADSAEFFSPPLPYLFPAGLVGLLSLSLERAAKGAQLLNVVVSVGLTLFLLKVCDLIDPGRLPLKLGTLSFIGVLPVYYKTFAFVRGEPFVVFFAVVAVYCALQLVAQPRPSWVHAIALGVALGLAGLSRQWGLLLLPGLALWVGITLIKTKQQRKRLLTLFFVSFVIACVLSGWFFLTLHLRYGSLTAFNRVPQERFALSNQDSSFYLGSGNGHLFTDPVRSAFPNQLLPILYSETWGDYWGYFVVFGQDSGTGRWLDGYEWSKVLAEGQAPGWLRTNRYSVAPVLGRANLVGIFPTLLALAACVLGVLGLARFLRQGKPGVEAVASGLLTLLIATTLAGYLWFLIMYPNPGKGDTIKSTYLLQIFPLIAILVGVLLKDISQRSQALYVGLMGCLALVYLHNLQVAVTHFVGLVPQALP